MAKQSPRHRHTRGLALCCGQEPADSRVGELQRNRELPSLVSQVLAKITPAAAVPEPLVTSKTLCSAVKHLSHQGWKLQLRQPCSSQSELSPRNRFPICSFSGAIRNPPGHKPVQPALAGGCTRCSPEAPPKPSHSVGSVLSFCRVTLEPAGSPCFALKTQEAGR